MATFVAFFIVRPFSDAKQIRSGRGITRMQHRFERCQIDRTGVILSVTGEGGVNDGYERIDFIIVYSIVPIIF